METHDNLPCASNLCSLIFLKKTWDTVETLKFICKVLITVQRSIYGSHAAMRIAFWPFKFVTWPALTMTCVGHWAHRKKSSSTKKIDKTHPKKIEHAPLWIKCFFFLSLFTFISCDLWLSIFVIDTDRENYEDTKLTKNYANCYEIMYAWVLFVQLVSDNHVSFFFQSAKKNWMSTLFFILVFEKSRRDTCHVHQKWNKIVLEGMQKKLW